MEVNVAVGIIYSRTRILITKRAMHLHQGGLWEFPGGKIEKGESPQEALKRELKEEINIDIHTQAAELLGIVEHDYPDKFVRLHVFRVKTFSGIPQMLEGQLDWRWASLKELVAERFPLPEPNRLILKLVQEEPLIL